MSNNYRPDNDATAGDPWDTAFLSDRDVSGQVPINFVPHPGVFITPACFGNGTYEDSSFKECFSNLLASEFRRFIFDIYWDTINRRFTLCPVERPPLPNNTSSGVSMSLVGNALAKYHIAAMSSPFTIAPRQISSQNTTSATATSPGNATTTSNITTSIPPVATTTSTSGNTLYQLGPYQCTSTISLDTVISVLAEYFSRSADTIQARLQFLILNLHIASTISMPTGIRPTPSSSQLPSPNEAVRTYLNTISSFLYTPFLLHNERENINSSWFARQPVNYLPLLHYFTVNKLPSGELSTPDGWPNENYVQLGEGWRLLVGYGSVDSQMNDYNFNIDNATIFTPGYLQPQRNATLDSSGSVASGCFYNSSETSLSQLNSSWAVSSVMNVDQLILGYAADNLTTCGISPVLNFTLGNSPASEGYQPYQTFGNQALFSWASGEPRNASVANEIASGVQWECALMVSNNDYRGHWRVANCLRNRRVACREANQPYVWRLSTEAVPYNAGESACTGNTTFDVPRTGLENLYLYHQVRVISASQQDPSLLDGIWINFNSIDKDSCWVTTGVNGTCPYQENPVTVRQRTILVPTIAAFICLLITALTILVKCNTNRRKSKVRKRGEGGWDYEGVPS